MVTRRDYTKEQVAAARSVMIELVHLLGEYRADIVVVGGWVPELLLPNVSDPHVGSMDVDLALNHRQLWENGYRTIGELLARANYQQDAQQKFRYRRAVVSSTGSWQVAVDLMAGELAGFGKSHRHQRVQDVQPRKARGCDLAFEHPVGLHLDGPLPDGGIDRVRLQVASLAPFIVMKTMALRDRRKEKDSYDIVYCLRNAGIDAAVEAFAPLRSHVLVQEALEILGEKFASPDHVGPQDVVRFLEIQESEEREIVLRDAFERVAALLARLTSNL